MPDISLPTVVRKVLYPPVALESQFYVLLTDAGKASGKMNWRPELGERLTLDGEWGAYKGEKNFNFKSAAPNIPEDPRAQLNYVCERAHGLGPAMAAGIWAAKGENWRNVVAGEIRGFTDARYESFRESLSMVGAEADKSKVVSWLMSKGASMKMGLAAFDAWKREAIGVVQANPFRLADLPHYSFGDVDGAIREAFGIGLEDARRVQSAVLYKLRMLTSGGSTVIDWPTLRVAVLDLVGSHMGVKVAEAVKGMFKDGSLKGFTGSQSIALGTDYQNEVAILEWCRRKLT
jgi:hypothetical protein